MERGFWHPARGYWQAIGNRLPPYPVGTVEVPLRPGVDYNWNGSEWVHNPRPAPVPNPTPLDLLEEIEADETVLSDGMTRIGKLMSLLDQLNLMKFASARTIRHDDPRIQRFKAPLEYDDAGLIALFRRAAAR